MFEWRGYPLYSGLASEVDQVGRYRDESEADYKRRAKKKKKSDVQKIIEEMFGGDPGDPASTERALNIAMSAGQPGGRPMDLAFNYRSDPGYTDPYVNQMWENIRQKHDLLMKGKLREWMVPRGGL